MGPPLMVYSNHDTIFNSGKENSDSVEISGGFAFGQYSCDKHNHSGPFHQSLSSIILLGQMPREAISAGFDSPATQFQQNPFSIVLC